MLILYILSSCKMHEKAKVNSTVNHKNLYEYYINDNSKLYVSHDIYSSSYLVLANDGSFIFERHRDIRYIFLAGEFQKKNTLIKFDINCDSSFNIINRYKDSLTHEYACLPVYFENKKIYIKNDTIFFQKLDMKQPVLKFIRMEGIDSGAAPDYYDKNK